MNSMKISSASVPATMKNYGKEPVKEPKMEEIQTPSQPEEKSIWEMMQEAREKAEAMRERFKLPNTTRYGDAPLEAYARLARARTRSDVNAAAGYAWRRMSQLKAALRQDPENAERIRAAIGQLQKAVTRANKKRRDLDREKLIKMRQARAAYQKQHRKAQQLKLELQRRQSMRVIREHGYMREAEIDNRLQDQLALTRMELQTQMQQLSASTAASIAQYGGSAMQTDSTASAAAPAAVVSIEA